MAIELDKPPPNELRKEWALWFYKIWSIVNSGQVPVRTDSNRGAAGQAGRIIFNTTDGKLNIDNGTNWTLPDGTVT